MSLNFCGEYRRRAAGTRGIRHLIGVVDEVECDPPAAFAEVANIMPNPGELHPTSRATDPPGDVTAKSRPGDRIELTA